jgi:hypothetical protein
MRVDIGRLAILWTQYTRKIILPSDSRFSFTFM